MDFVENLYAEPAYGGRILGKHSFPLPVRADCTWLKVWFTAVEPGFKFDLLLYTVIEIYTFDERDQKVTRKLRFQGGKSVFSHKGAKRASVGI